MISFAIMAIYSNKNNPYLCPIGNSLMIIMADLYEILTVNFFIELLPIEEFPFCCFRANCFISTISKAARLLPGLLFLLTCLTKIFSDMFILNFAFNFMLFFISLVILLISKNLKPNPLTRLLSSIYCK